MTQSTYICDLLHKTHMAESHSISSPWSLIANYLDMVLIFFMIQLYTDQWLVLIICYSY